jgi:toxin-antitoxin system PIN domain toxin
VVDSNAWLALLVQQHEHHPVARQWFGELAPGQAGMCRVVQLDVIRFMGTARMMQGGAISCANAWLTIRELLEDERVEFLKEPVGIDTIVPTLLHDRVPTSGLAKDAYLAAFAMASRRCLLTRDRGFQQFRGLEVEILGD